VIVARLRESFLSAEPVTTEFVTLMRTTFAYYGELESQFLAKLPKHLHQSELIALINTEIRPRLFNHHFCERIPEALKSLRRAIVRLEDWRVTHPELPPAVNKLPALQAVAEQVEALYQRHWEYYRYQNNLREDDVVSFLLEVERITYDWDIFLEGFTGAAELLKNLSGRPLPEGAASIRIAYQRGQPTHFAAETLTTLTGFFQACYGFICAVHGLDPAAEPLTLLDVEIGEPVELTLAVPAAAGESFRRLLQYLFLKDMLQREPLLKFVMEAVLRDYGGDGNLNAPALPALQKEIAARLKGLPEDGRFRISDRSFPEDGVQVMHDLFVDLERKEIPHDALLASGEKLKRSAKLRKPAPKAPVQTELAPPPKPGAGNVLDSGTEHIRVLTDRELNFIPKP
jgi:hypothetical protein